MRTVEYLDEIKRQYRLTSDYQVHKLLGVSKQSITHYRNGHSSFADDVAARVAMLLKLDPLRVLADVHAERAKSEAARAVWRMIAARAAQTAAILLAVCAANLAAVPSSAEARTVNGLRGALDTERNIHSAQSRRRRPRRYSRRWCARGRQRARPLHPRVSSALAP